MIFAYRRVRHVVETDRGVLLVFPFVVESFVVALLPRRYFALMMMYAALAFQTVLQAPVVIQ